MPIDERFLELSLMVATMTSDVKHMSEDSKRLADSVEKSMERFEARITENEKEIQDLKDSRLWFIAYGAGVVGVLGIIWLLLKAFKVIS